MFNLYPMQCFITDQYRKDHDHFLEVVDAVVLLVVKAVWPLVSHSREQGWEQGEVLDGASTASAS